MPGDKEVERKVKKCPKCGTKWNKEYKFCLSCMYPWRVEVLEYGRRRGEEIKRWRER